MKRLAFIALFLMFFPSAQPAMGDHVPPYVLSETVDCKAYVIHIYAEPETGRVTRIKFNGRNILTFQESETFIRFLPGRLINKGHQIYFINRFGKRFNCRVIK
ncbi:TPA: hypothetical protein ACGQ50_000781 [Enterobacter cloacae]